VKFADLHLHTFFSDGTYSPQVLVKEARGAGLSVIAVTDHDTVEAVKPAIASGAESGIEVIPGIELSCDYSGSEIHILGYFVDCDNKELLDKLYDLKKNRIARIHKIVSKLNDMGLALNAQSVFDFAKYGTVGRLHVARALLKGKFISTLQEAFQKFIGDKSPAYVCGFKLNPSEAISLIKKAGGLPVLAHPHTMGNDDLIFEFKKLGLMGLEVYYPEHSQAMINFYLNIAKEQDLLVTGGSDCHGQAKSEAKIGSVMLAYEFVEKLKLAKQGL